jgi:hypothetical protein
MEPRMLEDAALDFLKTDEDTLGQIGLAITLLGFIVALVLSRGKGELLRAPYFALSGLLYLFGSVLVSLWLLTLQAAALGIVWVLISVIFLCIGALGYFYGVLALGRSRDAFGHGRYAFLAFIPFANLYLLSKPSKNELSGNRIPTIPLLSGGLGVLSGFVMLIAGVAFTVWFETNSDAMFEAAGSSDPDLQSAGADILIRSEGLEGALQIMASGVQLPIVVDESTTLSRIEAVGTVLRRTFVVDLEGAEMTNEFRTGILQMVCAYEPFKPLLVGGATTEEVYVRTDGAEIGKQAMTRETCGL